MRLAVNHIHLCGLIIKEDLSLNHRMSGVCIFIPKKLTNGCSTKQAERTMDLENNVQTRLVIFHRQATRGWVKLKDGFFIYFATATTKSVTSFKPDDFE